MAVTTIDGVNKIQIRNAKNGDFDLNFATGGGGSSEEMMEIWLDYNAQTYSYDISDFDGKGIRLPGDGFKAIIHVTYMDESQEDILANGYYLFEDRAGYRFIIPLSWYNGESIRIYLNNAIAESAEKINRRISFVNVGSEFTIEGGEVKPVPLSPVLIANNQVDFWGYTFRGEESKFRTRGDHGVFKGISNSWLMVGTYEDTIAYSQEIVGVIGIFDY